jgi:hypothetical protein
MNPGRVGRLDLHLAMEIASGAVVYGDRDGHARPRNWLAPSVAPPAPSASPTAA